MLRYEIETLSHNVDGELSIEMGYYVAGHWRHKLNWTNITWVINFLKKTIAWYYVYYAFVNNKI